MPAKDVPNRFPFINLKKALDRAQAIFNGDRSGKPMLVPTAFELWGYSSKSSGGFQTTAALKMYGLLEDEGANEERRVKLTDRARRYFLDERDEVRAAMLAEFALNPALFSVLWNDEGWSKGLPADTVARSHLKIERGMIDQSARALLNIFKDNIKYAGLMHSVQGEALVESDETEQVDEAPPRKSEESEKMDPRSQTLTPPPANPMPHGGAPIAPVLFDMKTVTISGRWSNAKDLQSLIDDLERLKPLMRPGDD